MPLDLFLAFLAASALLFAKPGPAMSVIVANSIGQGTRGGLVTVAGNVIGFVLLISLVALGLAVHRYSAQTLATRLGHAFALYAETAETHPTPFGTTQEFSYAAFKRALPAP